jgi:hypothetical protein
VTLPETIVLRVKTTAAKPMDYALEDFWKFSKVVMTDKTSIEIIPIYNTIKKEHINL